MKSPWAWEVPQLMCCSSGGLRLGSLSGVGMGLGGRACAQPQRQQTKQKEASSLDAPRMSHSCPLCSLLSSQLSVHVSSSDLHRPPSVIITFHRSPLYTPRTVKR